MDGVITEEEEDKEENHIRKLIPKRPKSQNVLRHLHLPA